MKILRGAPETLRHPKGGASKQIVGLGVAGGGGVAPNFVYFKTNTWHRHTDRMDLITRATERYHVVYRYNKYII